MILATPTCYKIQHMGAKPPHLLELKSYLGSKSKNLLIREVYQVVAFWSNFRTAPSTTRSFCSRESIRERKKGRYKGIRVQDPSSFRQDPLRSLTCPVYSTDTRETTLGFLPVHLRLPFRWGPTTLQGATTNVFLNAPRRLGAFFDLTY